MANGLHRDGETEIRLVQQGKLVRRVVLDGSGDPSVTVTRVIAFDASTGNPRDVFDAEVRALEDLDAGIQRCGFCEKTRLEVKTLIAGSATYICDECVGVCAEVLAEQG